MAEKPNQLVESSRATVPDVEAVFESVIVYGPEPLVDTKVVPVGNAEETTTSLVVSPAGKGLGLVIAELPAVAVPDTTTIGTLLASTVTLEVPVERKSLPPLVGASQTNPLSVPALHEGSFHV